MDELLIEVSRSTYNSLIFLVPKPHSQGIRTVLNYRTVNLKSKPDRYSISEIRECIDKIGLAELNINRPHQRDLAASPG